VRPLRAVPGAGEHDADDLRTLRGLRRQVRVLPRMYRNQNAMTVVIGQAGAGATDPEAEAVIRRFAKYVRPDESGCLVWHGHTSRSGYGYLWNGSKSVRAHRWIYMQMVGAIPDGLTVDHLCCRKLCVNWQHMELVTAEENYRRYNATAVRPPPNTHCPAGHPFAGANLYVHPLNGKRQCRTCRRLAEARRRREGRATR
jgi:hypothetical protein